MKAAFNAPAIVIMTYQLEHTNSPGGLEYTISLFQLYRDDCMSKQGGCMGISLKLYADK